MEWFGLDIGEQAMNTKPVPIQDGVLGSAPG